MNYLSNLVYLPAPSELNRKFQQDTTDEIPQDLLYWGRLMQYLTKRIYLWALYSLKYNL